MTVFVVGSINEDLILRVAALPDAGATVLASEQLRAGGGKGANVAVAAARDGAAVAFVGAVGADAAGRAALADLAEDGVDTTSVAVLGEQPTGLAVICVDDAGENQIVVASGANAAVDGALVTAGLARLGAGDVCVAGFELPDAAVAAAAARAHERGALLVLNPSPVRPIDAGAFAAAPVVVANAGEAGLLTGADDAEAAAQELLARGCRAALVTLGARGVLAVDRAGSLAVAPTAVTPVDTTGAGDTFTGLLAAALARGEPLAAAARRAAAGAALSTTRVGARAAMPRTADIDRALAAAH